MEKTNTYYILKNGNKIIRVSQAIKNFLGDFYANTRIPQRYLEAARDLGIKVHAAIAFDLEGDLELSQELIQGDAKATNLFQQFLIVKQQLDLKNQKKEVEFFVHNSILGGTIDCTYLKSDGKRVLIDWKTRNITQKTHIEIFFKEWVQLLLYLGLYRAHYFKQKKHAIWGASEIIIVLLNKNAKKHAAPVILHFRECSPAYQQLVLKTAAQILDNEMLKKQLQKENLYVEKIQS